MNPFKYVFEKLRASHRRAQQARVIQRSIDTYGVTVYKGAFWFTCNGILLFPCDMVCDGVSQSIIDFVERMREFFVERNGLNNEEV